MPPNYIYEHIIAKNYGWSLKEIRSMTFYDFQAHLAICLAAEDSDVELKARLAGIDVGKKTGKKTTKQINKNKKVVEEQLIKT